MATPFRISQLLFTPTPSPQWTDTVFAASIGVWLALSPEGAGTADKVLRSTDGLTWAEHTLPVGAPWNSLVWSEDAGLFAAFCTNNSACSVATSPDGITWTNRHAEQASIRSAVYAQGKFTGVGGQQQVIGPNVFSKANFTLQANGVATRTVNINMSVSRVMFVGVVGAPNDYVDGGGAGVTFNGVAMTLVGKVQVSGDRWIYLFKLLNPSLGGSFALTVTFNTTNNGTTVTDVGSAIYISGYSNAGDVVQSSTDTGNSASTAKALTTTVNGSWLLQFSCNAADSTGTAGSNTTVRQTTDGQGGTMADSNQAYAPGSNSIAVNVTSSQWAAITIAFRPQPTDSLITSSDGVTWVESEMANETMQAVAYSPTLDLFCAVAAGPANGGGFGSTFCILTSPDGATWTYRDLGSSAGADLSATGSCVLVWANTLDLFVVVLSDGTVRKSADGITWSEITLPVDATIPLVLGVTWAERLGMLIFFTEADTPGLVPLLYSEDGSAVVPVDYLTTEDTDGDWSTGVYSPVHDRMVVFPVFNTYALLVEFGPDLVEVNPPYGDIVGGNTVQLIGTGFVDGMEVVFDNKFATDVIVISSRLATCTVPPHVIAGFVNVTVTNPDDRFDTEALIYEYREAIDPATGDPEIFPGIGWMGSGCAPGSIVPDHGSMVGGTPVTIYGQGFRAGSTVYFGGSPATSVFIDTIQPWPALVTAKNPDAWWRLEEASGALVLEDEMGTHDATLPSATGKTSVRGGLSYSPTKGIALAGPSAGFSFDGTQGAAVFTGLETLLAGPLTIEFLFKPNGISGYGTIIGDTSAQDGIYYFNNGQNWISYESATGGYADQTNTTPFVTGQTYHIALVLDGLGGGQWVIDGVADATVTNVNLGGVLNTLFSVNGFALISELVDEIAVYGAALSVPTLLNHSSNRDTTYPALVLADGAIAYWRCAEANDATVLADTTGNGHDATQPVGGRTSVTGALADGHDIATIPSLPLSGTYSIEFLINPLDTNAVQALLTSLAALGFFIDPDMRLRAQVAHTVMSDVALAVDAISHVVFTASGTVGSWYINGVAHGSGTWDNTDDVALVRMLADTTGNTLVCNVLDEVVVHSVELSAADVTAHYTAARSWVSGTFITCITPPHQTGAVDVEVVSP